MADPDEKSLDEWLSALQAGQHSDADDHSALRAVLLRHHTRPSVEQSADAAWQKLRFRLRRERLTSARPWYASPLGAAAIAAGILVVVAVPVFFTPGADQLTYQTNELLVERGQAQEVSVASPKQSAQAVADILAARKIRPVAHLLRDGSVVLDFDVPAGMAAGISDKLGSVDLAAVVHDGENRWVFRRKDANQAPAAGSVRN